MKHLVIVPFVLATALVGALATPARADECNKLTYLTFSAPVALPGVALRAGTYRFTHPDCETGDGLLRVSSRDGREAYGTFVTVPERRPSPSTRVEVVFARMPTGSPEAIKEFFYPGDKTGDGLVYSKQEAPIVAEAPVQNVLAANGHV